MTLRTVVVDDDDDFRFMLREFLRLDGRFEIVGEADNVDHALALVDEVVPRLVVTDLVVGAERLDAIQRFREATPRPVVAVLSGHDRRAAEARVLAAGADAFFEKMAIVTLMDDLVALVEATG